MKAHETEALIRRLNAAVDAIGGPLALVELPPRVRAVLKSYVSLEAKVKMMEAVAEAKAADARRTSCLLR